MKLEHQVCSLKLAQKLKELGAKQDSYFYHYNEPFKDGEDDWVITNLDDYETAYDNKSEPYSAFTVAELGKMLPGIIHRGDIRFNLQFYKLQGNAQGDCYWDGQYYDCETGIVLHAAFEHFFIADESEVNCRAKMLIYLLENKLLEPEK